MGLYVSNVGNLSAHILYAYGTLPQDPVVAGTYRHTPAATGNAQTTIGFTALAWNHGCGVWAADNDRRVYLNGGSKGTNATDLAIADTIKMSFAVDYQATGQTYWYKGRIAEAAIWNVALTDAEAAVLGAGYCPLFVRPQSLVSYWPLIRDEDLDRVGVTNLTPINAPTIEEHAPILYPHGPSPGRAAPVTGAAPMKGWGWGWTGA